ncbi:IS630 family transposase [Aliikangiella sp. IMCC44359]|uniref:IS630 family transposase n=1 Tax=Aliikangiella sp. IMCC44359 TaxID=3459125 RepID=UPI00403A834E
MCHPKADELKRARFQQQLSRYEQLGKPVVYLDESGFAQSSPRTHGYSDKGQRCYGVHDWHAKGRINAIGAIIRNTFVTLSLFAGSINADVFHAWVTQDLLPKVPSNAVIVMDNASFHKRKDICEAIEKKGCILQWLPPYSPDLNPIEKKWAQAKAIRRKKRCSVDELFQEDCLYDKIN